MQRMAWLPPWLGAIFGKLFRAKETAPFEAAWAASTLSMSPNRVGFALSRIVRDGWAVRESRGVYRLVHPAAVVALEASGLSTQLGRSSVYPVLALAVSQAIGSLGPQLESLAIFGSVARQEYGTESDLDLLAVVGQVPPTWAETSRQIAPIERAVDRLNRTLWEYRGERHPVQVVLMDAEILREEPRLLLDLTEDARIVWDRNGLLETTLGRLRTRLQARGSRRIAVGSGRWLWDLTPGRTEPPIEAL